jgi:hypothetical protein
MKGDLVIGNGIKLIPKEEWEELKDINSFMSKIGVSPKELLKIKNYITKDLYKLGIYNSISEKYSNGITTEINVIIQGNYRGFPATIDDPEEIDRFLSGEDAIAIDSNGGEHDVRKESSEVLDWDGGEYGYFYFKKMK